VYACVGGAELIWCGCLCGEGERKRARARERVCVGVRERERDRESVSYMHVCVCMRMHISDCVCGFKDMTTRNVLFCFCKVMRMFTKIRIYVLASE